MAMLQRGNHGNVTERLLLFANFANFPSCCYGVGTFATLRHTKQCWHKKENSYMCKFKHPVEPK